MVLFGGGAILELFVPFPPKKTKLIHPIISILRSQMLRSKACSRPGGELEQAQLMEKEAAPKLEKDQQRPKVAKTVYKAHGAPSMTNFCYPGSTPLSYDAPRSVTNSFSEPPPIGRALVVVQQRRGRYIEPISIFFSKSD